MPTIAGLNNQLVTDRIEDCQILTRGGRNASVVITGGSVYMQLANNQGGGWGLEEFHGPESFVISDEDIWGIRFRNGQAGATTVRVNVSVQN